MAESYLTEINIEPEMSHAEIAKRLGVSRETVRNAERRAMRKIRKMIAEGDANDAAAKDIRLPKERKSPDSFE